MIAIDQRARILNVEDAISTDVYVVIEGPDRKGNFLLAHQQSHKRVRAHPSRILVVNDAAAPVYRTAHDFRTKCPQCRAEAVVDVGVDRATCASHGVYEINWGGVDAGPTPLAADEVGRKPSVKKRGTKKRTSRRPAADAKKSTAIDFEAMAAVGELWTKSDVEFDYPDYSVMAHVLIIDDGQHSRKYCFNSYNGTWGKKPKDADLLLFTTNTPAAGGKPVGYYLKGTIEQERVRLTRDGYRPHAN